jgi:HEAT repeat protein
VSGYEALAELAQRELELVSAGAVEDLPELQEQRRALVATLPQTPPPAARPALERAAALQSRVTSALAECLRESGGELRKLSHGRTAVAGYAPHDEPLKLVDRAG